MNKSKPKTKSYTLKSIKKYNHSEKGKQARKRYYKKNREKILERAKNKRKEKNKPKVLPNNYNRYHTVNFIHFKEPITMYFD